MDFQVHCECGEYVAVSEGAAGARLQCSCGRMIAVPSLAELRRQAGLSAHKLRPHVVIENMLAHGELPTMTTCACCTDATDKTVGVTAECEKAWSSEPSTITWIISYLVLGIWGILLLLAQGEGRERGTNLIVHLPVRICRGCQKQLSRNLVTLTLGLAEIVLAAAGLLIMIFWTPWGGLLLVGSVLAWLMETIVMKQRQAAIKNLLVQEPIYKQLLDDFPMAKLVLNIKRRSV